MAPPATSAGWLPLRQLCRYADGTTTDLVPGYVNPLLFLCLAIAVSCTALALRSARRLRGESSSARPVNGRSR